MCDRRSGNKALPKHLFVLSGRRHAIGRRLFFLGRYHVDPLYRARRCRDLSEERRSIAPLCAPSTEMQTHYSLMSEHYSSLAEAEEVGNAGLPLLATSTVPT